MIGWKEHVRLPKLAIGPIVAKIDTGARSAALHVDAIEFRGSRVSFVTINDGKRHIHLAALRGVKRIKSSNGISETRAVIETEIQLGRQKFMTEITLTNRTDMEVPMLLGRSSIRGRFLVHPGRTFILSKKSLL
jgi:hypothetical protein